jgi:hypothetical protein
MAADIVPQLYEDILDSFNKAVEANKRIWIFEKKLEAGTATEKDAAEYAKCLGECAEAALSSNLTEERLPDGKLYWNIAERTIKPLLKEAYELVMKAAAGQLQLEDRKAGINLKPVETEFPEERINELIDTIIRYSEDGNEPKI